MPTNQITFVQSLPPGVLLSADNAQQPHVARSHAARVGHQRSRARSSRKDDGLSLKPRNERYGQAVVPFRIWRPPAAPPSPEDEGHEITLHDTAPRKAFFPQLLPSPPLSHSSIDSDTFDKQDDGDRSEQECGHLEYTIDTSLITASFRQSPYENTTPFTTSLRLERFSGLSIDPFSCIPRSGDSRVRSAIHFFCQVLSTGNDMVCYVFNVSNVYASFLENLQDEYLFDAGLGVLQFLQEQIRSPGSRPSVHTLKHLGYAIARLRDKLSESAGTIDDLTILSMLFLATLDKSLRNLVAYSLHRKNIAMAISERGGLEVLQNGSILKNYLIHYDTFWLMEGEDTMFPERHRYEPVYPTHPFSMDLCAFIAGLPLGFRRLVTEDALSLDILPLLSRATQLTRLSDRDRYKLISKTWGLSKRYNDFWEACPCLCTSDDSGSVLEKLLSLTLFCYCYIAFGSSPYPTQLRAARLEATKTIKSFYSKSEAEEACLIWMWVVITDSWRQGSRLQPNGTSLLFNLQSRYPALRNACAVTGIVSQFLWTRDLSNSIQIYFDDLISAD